MATLTRANQELFCRQPDERFRSLDDLQAHCQTQQTDAEELWVSPRELSARPVGGETLDLGCRDMVLAFNDWSFTQLCRLCGAGKVLLNRLSPETGTRVIEETLPRTNKPWQVFSDGQVARSIQPSSYTRLYNAEVLEMLREFATDLTPPYQGSNGASGLYCGEQDMFVFLIDPHGWVEIDEQAFAPGLFIWNSEVGRRSLGVQTFWFQAICCNHIVWDAVEVVERTWRHTAGVHNGLDELRDLLEALLRQSDARRDSFANVIRKAMEASLGDDEHLKQLLADHYISRQLARHALSVASEKGRLTVFSLVDALTRLSGRMENAGDRTEVDRQVSQLLSLAV